MDMEAELSDADETAAAPAEEPEASGKKAKKAKKPKKSKADDVPAEGADGEAKKSKLPLPGTSATRRSFLIGAASTGIGLPIVRGLFASDPVRTHFTQDTSELNPTKAMELLKRGNSRFVKMKEVDPNLNAARRISVAEGQHPFAAIIGCVDSRVPPELVFDRGLGDLFVARVAGNIADDSVIGSIEFGVEEFDIPLVVIMGHTKCGAVKATVEALESGETEAPGQIGRVVEAIAPAVEGITDVTEAVIANVKQSVALFKESEILGQRMEFGVLHVVGAVYDIETGEVDFTIVPAGEH